jgi:hypothetical protein
VANMKAKKPAIPRSNGDIADLLLSEAQSTADAKGLLTAIIDEIGGVRELARIFARELRNPETSAQTRQRLIETVQRLIIMCTQANLSKQVEPSEMTDDDLKAVTMRLLTKVQHAAAQSAGPGTQEQGPS